MAADTNQWSELLPMFDDIPDDISRILQKATVEPRNTILEELGSIAEENTLRRTRDIIFELSTRKLQKVNKISNVGGLKLKARKAERPTGYCKDIYDMFVYIADLDNTFPRGVLGSSSVSNIDNMISSETMNNAPMRMSASVTPNDASSTTQACNTYTETEWDGKALFTKLVLMQHQLQELSFENTKIKGDIKKLQGQVCKCTCTCSKSTTNEVRLTKTKEPNPPNTTSSSKATTHVSNTDTHCVSGANNDKYNGTNKPMQNTNTAFRSNSLPDVMSSVQPKPFMHLVTATNTKDVNKPHILNHNNEGTRIEARASTQPPPPPTLSYSQVTKTSRPVERHDMRPTRDVPSRQSSLKGIKHERYRWLYLENIARSEYDDDDATIHQIQSHAHITGIRIMKLNVIHNRFAIDRVGCKIAVSESSADKALEPVSWPYPVTCREWEQRPRRNDIPRYRSQRRNNYYDNDNYGDDNDNY
ncbi:unnamed protein product [Owenia fusiformis]|uniref:Uncharacterized protein n=1 Tax=Owenia fusiformis TaxID=6347 RepID=A0A8J1Y3Z0_OWEFU|nr:unnamed protein product [Owenia fusiformis]